MLVLSRAGAVVMLAPGLGETEAPATVRAGLSLALAFLLLPVVAPLLPASPGSAFSAAAMVAAELFAGAVLGTLARMVALSLGMLGALLSYQTGLSSVIQPDPALGGQSVALGRLFGVVMPVLVLSTGLYALPLSALAGSYTLVPPGSWFPVGAATDGVVQAVAQSFSLALQLAAPLMIASMAWQAMLGVMARLVPQMQVYSASAPGQIMGGLALLGVLALHMLEPWQEAVRTAWQGLPGL